MRLIDADALIERTEILDDVFIVNWTTKKVQSLISTAPTIDAVPVVRCKDCKNRTNRKCPLVWGGVMAKWQGENFWCSYGERRSDG